jgi:hypothetical protein
METRSFLDEVHLYGLVGEVVGGFVIQAGGLPGPTSVSVAKNSAMADGSLVKSLAASFDTVCLRLEIQRSLETSHKKNRKRGVSFKNISFFRSFRQVWTYRVS